MEGIKAQQVRSHLRLHQQDKMWRIAAKTHILAFTLANRRMKNVSFDMAADEGRIAISKFESSLSQGNIKGDLELATSGTFSYNIGLTIEQVPANFFALETFKIEKQMKGAINGHLRIQGDSQKIDGLDAKFQAPQGMYVNAKLLSPLLQHIPQSVQREKIEVLIDQGGNIYLDDFKLDVTNEPNGMLKTVFDLKSVDYNLDVNLGVDINVEGGLMALVQQGLNYFPQTTGGAKREEQ
jgi:hypothetical protein